MTEIITVPSSSGDGSYEVRVIATDESVQVVCNCQAGQFGKLCRHQIKVIRVAMGLESVAGILGNMSAISVVITSSKLPSIVKQLDESEQALEGARKRVAHLKKVLERQLTGET